MAEALRSGFVAEEIRKSQERRRQQIATGATAIVGVTKFANAHETLPSILAVDADFGSGEAEPMGIRPKRDAEDCELGSGER